MGSREHWLVFVKHEYIWFYRRGLRYSTHFLNAGNYRPENDVLGYRNTETDTHIVIHRPSSLLLEKDRNAVFCMAFTSHESRHDRNMNGWLKASDMLSKQIACFFCWHFQIGNKRPWKGLHRWHFHILLCVCISDEKLDRGHYDITSMHTLNTIDNQGPNDRSRTLGGTLHTRFHVKQTV